MLFIGAFAKACWCFPELAKIRSCGVALLQAAALILALAPQVGALTIPPPDAWTVCATSGGDVLRGAFGRVCTPVPRPTLAQPLALSWSALPDGREAAAGRLIVGPGAEAALRAPDLAAVLSLIRLVAAPRRPATTEATGTVLILTAAAAGGFRLTYLGFYHRAGPEPKVARLPGGLHEIVAAAMIAAPSLPDGESPAMPMLAACTIDAGGFVSPAACP